jgi:PAS domain S-box-containing protein
MTGEADPTGGVSERNQLQARSRWEWVALCAVLLAAGGYTGLKLRSSHHQVEVAEREQLEQQARMVEALLGPRLQATSNALESLRASIPDLLAREDGVSVLGQRMQMLVSAMTGVRTFVLVNAEGTLVASNRKELIGTDWRNGERYRTISNRPDASILYVSPPWMTPLSNWAVSLGRAIVDRQGGFGGYVLAIVDPGYFSLLLESTRHTPDTATAVIHGRGTVVCRVPDSMNSVGMNLAEMPDAVFNKHIQSGSDATSWTGVLKTTGEEALTVFQTIRPSTSPSDEVLVASFGRETSTIFASWRRQARDQVLLLAVVALAATLGLFFGQQRRAAKARNLAEREAERSKAEQALRASEERHRNLFDNLDAGIVVHAPDTSIVQSNLRASVLLGLTSDQMRGKVAIDPGWRFVREDGSTMPLPEYPVSQVVDSGSPVVGQVIGVDHPAGAGRTWALVNAYPEFDEARALRQVVVTFIDITNRKEAEQALHLQQARLDSAALSGKLGLWDLDLATGKAWRTLQHDRLFGYEELQSTWGPEDALRHVLPEDRPIFQRAFEEAVATGRFHYEIRIRPVNHPQRWIEATGEVVRDESGKPIRIRGTVANITDRKQAELAVADREAELRTFLDAIPIPAFRKDTESRWQLGNRALFATIGRKAEACLGKTDLEIYGDPAIGEAVMQNDRRILLSGIAEVIEEEIQTPTGPRTFHSTKVPYRDVEGRVIGIVGAALDVTDRKRAEEALRAASAYARGLIEASLDPLVTISPNGKITDANRATEEATGLPRSQIVGTDFAGYFTDPEKARAGYEQVLAQGEVRDYPLTLRHESGRAIDVLYNAAVYTDSRGQVQGVFAAARDVTERRKGEAALRKSEARFRGLFDSMMDGFVVVGMDGVIRDSNEVYRKMLGYSADELAQVTYKDLTPERWHPVEARIVAEQVLPRGFSDVYEKEYRRRDGTVFPVELRTSLLTEHGRPEAMWAIVRDVTAVRALQAELTLNSRLAALGTLVAGVAHEVNNPLAATLADQGLAREAVREVRDHLRTSEPIDRQAETRRLDEVIEELEDAEVGGRRIAQIVKDLAKFARPSEEKARVRIIDTVQQAMRWLPATVGRVATISVEDGGAPDVVASFGQIEQVVVNLVTNAAKASKPGELGAVVIRTSPGSPGMSRVDVIDRGVGIEPAIRDRIFDPFFTTRQVGEGKGMGLGLSICHSIVTRHGGTITVESEVGKGSTFRVELPALPAEA